MSTRKSPMAQPPVGELTDQARARIRAGLIEAASHEAPRGRPWLAPVAAAAAVASLLSAGAIVAWAQGDEPSTVAGIASSGPGLVQPSAMPSTDPWTGQVPTATESGPASSASPSTNPGAGEAGSCATAILDYLPGAREVDTVTYDGGSSILYAAGDRSRLCDTWAAADGGAATIFEAHRLDAPLGKDLFLISQNYSTDDPDAAQFVAGGGVLDDVSAISYAFPTGDTVEATITDHMWQMVYQPSGLSSGTFTRPVNVTVTLADAVEWASRCPVEYAVGPGLEAVIEVRRVADMTELPEATDEQVARQQRLRDQFKAG